MTSHSPTLPVIEAGEGRVVLKSYGSEVAFTELSATYPLKLLSPRNPQQGVAVVYVVSYGGGLVGGDFIKLIVEAGSCTTLLLLSQGSTKVFKARPGDRAATQRTSCQNSLSGITQYVMDVTVSEGSVVLSLPDPVTCFRSASYRQIQTFHLRGDASMVLLDWVTCGRKSLGEVWAFSKYYSASEIWLDGKRVILDVLFLQEDEQEEEPGSGSSFHKRALTARLEPYSCYANLILYGPLVHSVIREVFNLYEAISVLKSKTPVELLWSCSPISDGAGCIIRIGGTETELVKQWLRDTLSGLENIVGLDAYSKVFV